MDESTLAVDDAGHTRSLLGEVPREGKGFDLDDVLLQASVLRPARRTSERTQMQAISAGD